MKCLLQRMPIDRNEKSRKNRAGKYMGDTVRIFFVSDYVTFCTTLDDSPKIVINRNHLVDRYL